MRVVSAFALLGAVSVVGCGSGTTGGGGFPDGGAGSGNTGNFGGFGNTGNSGGSGNSGNFGGFGNTGNSGGMAGSGNTGNFGGFGNTGGMAGSGNTGNTGGTGGCTSNFDCDDFDACTDDLCEGTTCVHDAVSVDDFNACTTDSCNSSTGVSHVPVSVDDFDACTTDSCNSSTGVSHTPISCDDFDPCTTDTCNSSTGCVHTPISGGGTIFSEDFSDNSAGWLLDSEWAIGPAVSGCSSYPDPSTDTTPTSDNGIAGVVIGGCQTTTVHSYYYLTSPTINTASATTVTLKFNRWLKSDYTPYVKNVIEVYNGSTWTTIWSTGSSSTSDSSWLPQSFDITAYKSSAMKIRFGHNVGSSGAIAKGSWSIDDVEITSGSGTCTP